MTKMKATEMENRDRVWEVLEVTLTDLLELNMEAGRKKHIKEKVYILKSGNSTDVLRWHICEMTQLREEPD